MADVSAPAATLQRKRVVRKRVPKPSIQILDNPAVDNFFRGREKDPLHYTFTPEGNLQIRGVKDVTDEVIRLPNRFEALNEAQYADLMRERQEKLVETEKAFDAALSQLRMTLARYNDGEVGADDVVLANTTVLEANKLRTKAAYPERWISTAQNPEIREVLMNYDPFEKRKFGYDVYLFKHHELGRKQAWGQYVARTSGGAMEDNEHIRIRFITDVNDASTGHFHPFFQKNFVFNETEYCCAVQAYEAERFKELGKEDLRKQVLGTRSGRTIHSIAIKDKALPNQPQKLWEDILFHFFQQHPDLRKELEATGSEKFHVMDKEVPAEVGPALEVARARLRELGDKDVEHQDVKEKVVTEEEQKKAKVGAIIHNFRKH